MKKLVVDLDLCEGNGICMSLAPEAFNVGDDDKATIVIEHPDQVLLPRIERAIERCPRGALSLQGE